MDEAILRHIPHCFERSSVGLSSGRPQRILPIKTLSIGFLCHITSSHLMLLGSTQIKQEKTKTGVGTERWKGQ